MSATNPNQETDSLKFTKNEDGSFSVEWDKEDPNWKWMNSLTSKEIQVIIQQAIQEFTNGI
jgi:hypothetical protein